MKQGIPMPNEILPLGTIVYLENGTKKIMIIGRGAVMEDEDTGEDVYFDYMGAAYPEGIDPDNAIFFNQDNIDEVIFKGYEDGLTIAKKTF